MAEVTVSINNKHYGIACDDGQEDRVRELARYVDERLRTMLAGGPAVSESQNLVLTGIIMADEIADLRDYIANLEQQQHVAPRVEIKEVPVEVPGAISEEEEERFAQAVDKLAARIDTLANKIAKAA